MRSWESAGGDAQCMFQGPLGGYLARADQHDDGGEQTWFDVRERADQGSITQPLAPCHGLAVETRANSSMLIVRVKVEHETTQLESKRRGVIGNAIAPSNIFATKADITKSGR